MVSRNLGIKYMLLNVFQETSKAQTTYCMWNQFKFPNNFHII